MPPFFSSAGSSASSGSGSSAAASLPAHSVMLEAHTGQEVLTFPAAHFSVQVQTMRAPAGGSSPAPPGSDPCTPCRIGGAISEGGFPPCPSSPGSAYSAPSGKSHSGRRSGWCSQPGRPSSFRFIQFHSSGSFLKMGVKKRHRLFFPMALNRPKSGHVFSCKGSGAGRPLCRCFSVSLHFSDFRRVKAHSRVVNS